MSAGWITLFSHIIIIFFFSSAIFPLTLNYIIHHTYSISSGQVLQLLNQEEFKCGTLQAFPHRRGDCRRVGRDWRIPEFQKCSQLRRLVWRRQEKQWGGQNGREWGTAIITAAVAKKITSSIRHTPTKATGREETTEPNKHDALDKSATQQALRGFE